MAVPRVVILGHSGFIGSHLEALLSKTEKWEVIGRSLPEIDLTNVRDVDKLIPFFDSDTVLILAAAVKRQFGDTLEAFQQNMAIVQNVCRLLEAHPIRRVVFFSSAAVYGEETENTDIHEQTPVNPTSFYGISKFSSERILRKACEVNPATSLVCLRPPLIYGPGDKGHTYGPAGFSADALENKPITLWGNGTELREFIYIDDVCYLIERLIDHEFSGELNVVSGVRCCFADIIKALYSLFPDLEVNSRPRSRQKANNAFVPDLIRSLLPDNFEFTSLQTGLSEIINAAGKESQ